MTKKDSNIFSLEYVRMRLHTWVSESCSEAASPARSELERYRFMSKVDSNWNTLKIIYWEESQKKVEFQFTWDLLNTVRVFFFFSFPPLPHLPSWKVMNLDFLFQFKWNIQGHAFIGTLDTESFCPRSPLDTLSSAAMSSSSSDKFSTDPGRGNDWWTWWLGVLRK